MTEVEAKPAMDGASAAALIISLIVQIAAFHEAVPFFTSFTPNWFESVLFVLGLKFFLHGWL